MNAQDPTIPTATQAVGIDAVVLDLQLLLDTNLNWLTNGMGRAYILNKQLSNGVSFFRPQVWLGGDNQDYHEPLPDNDQSGSSYFIVKSTAYPNQQIGRQGYKENDVSIIFTVNLKIIDPVLILTENFTRHLMGAVEKVLIESTLGKDYQLTVNSSADVFEEVFAESDIDTLQGKAFGKMNYFRFDTSISFLESCPSASLNRCAAVRQNLSQDDLLNCILPTYNFADLATQAATTPLQQSDMTTWLCGAFVNQYQMQFNGISSNKQAPINAAYDFISTDSFSLECWVTFNVLSHASIMSKYSNALTRGYWVNVMANGSIRFSIQNSGGGNGIIVSTLPGVLSVGAKTHIEAVYTGTETAAGMALYVNGLPVVLIPVVDNLTAGADITNNENLTLGALPTAGLYSNAAIDEWRVRNIALTPAQVLIEYNGGTPAAPVAGGLILYDRAEGAIFGVSQNWVSEDLSGTLGIGVGTETVLVPYSGRIAS